ncbi:uncharacterized protein MYCFIDRAFT_188290 [Pseudocercospora fijiensis CIRAD86]|uniref:S1/P1 nuclease n=1 Tax=Pseudocercospora fijiensis (strain CIRAD86) TaxID=383855 RepID=M2ZW05_PSEFD|nr:uncharacterized protein MYCFIDRAFT_188290 [Pseudocercospora fijiensis CIRAD86]EME83179.1 hypothetical protein MYCFIDRAFT_188290 [Pseudocercospora fijiensis CIRAD86]
MKLAIHLACFGRLVVPSTAWYLQVHNQIGYVVDQLLNQNTKYMLSQILEPEYKGSVGRSAAWADTVSRTTAPYSYNWHWISARDNPPDDCGLFYHRDCQQGGCVVSQIFNQTSILRPCIADLAKGHYKPDQTCAQALKWTIHFIMDVCEPMHTSMRALGGNRFPVTFNGTETNMHQTWDRWILYAGTDRPNGFADDKIDPYFQGLYERIRREQNGKVGFREPIDDWAICNWDIERGTYCPEKWAQSSNAIVCDYAYGRYVNGSDVYKDGYAEGAFHIIELQLAKGKRRST